MSTGLLTEVTSGRGARPERRRPAPRKPGWKAALEACQCEDRLLNTLLPGKAFEAVTPSQVATALEFAEEVVGGAWQRQQYMRRVGDPTPVYRINIDNDVGWLRRAQKKRIDMSDGHADADLLERLREIVEAVPWDAASAAALNVARYVAHRFERSNLVTAMA
jgi:hypothetical protein